MRIAGLTELSLSDFPGRVAAVAFTRGCNYSCSFCHNRQILDVDGEASDNEEDIFRFLKRRRGFIDGLVITGGEPCIQQGLVDFCRKVKALGVAVKLDTNGSRPDVLSALFAEKLLDYVAMDIKAPFDKYDALCGKAVDKQAVRRSMELLINSRTKIEFRTTIVPRLLDEKDILKIGKSINGRAPHYLQRYVEQKEPGAPTGEIEALSSLDINSLQINLNERFGQTYVR
jgi:pyruvate formate lyase activating enzyme